MLSASLFKRILPNASIIDNRILKVSLSPDSSAGLISLSKKQVAASAAVGFDSTSSLRLPGSNLTAKCATNKGSFIGSDDTSWG